MQAIFSDDSDEGEDNNIVKVENQEKKAEVANTALSRLIAGDFLESLGKELGIEVPPDTPYPTQKSGKDAPLKENVNEYAKPEFMNGENNSVVSLKHDLPQHQYIAHEGGPSRGDNSYGNMLDNQSIRTKGTSVSDSKSRKSNGEKREDDRKVKSPLVRNQDYSSSSEEERSRKRSRHHRHRRRDVGSDSSSDDEKDRRSSRSKGRREKSSREKSSGSKKHSKHKKHRKHDSPSRSSHYSMDRDDAYSRKEKRRRE